jgi:hypothetical protein
MFIPTRNDNNFRHSHGNRKLANFKYNETIMFSQSHDVIFKTYVFQISASGGYPHCRVEGIFVSFTQMPDSALWKRSRPNFCSSFSPFVTEFHRQTLPSSNESITHPAVFTIWQKGCGWLLFVGVLRRDNTTNKQKLTWNVFSTLLTLSEPCWPYQN